MIKQVEAYSIPPDMQHLERIQKLNLIQDEAVKAAIFMDKKTVCAATGIGKTFIAFKYLYRRLSRGDIKSDDPIWFLAETNTRQLTLDEEVKKFKEIYGKNIYHDFNITFMCYQSQPKGKPKLMICDEIHESLTPKYSQIYHNGCKYILGLSATIPQNLKVYRDDEENELTKGSLLARVAPIVFNYPLSSAVDDGILAPYRTTLIHHTLDAGKKIIPSKAKGKEFLTTESQYYSYRKGVLINRFMNQFYKGACAKQMCRLLWNLPSKVQPVKELLSTLEGKTIVFGTQLNLLEKITDNVVKGGNKSQENKNKKLIDDFNSGKIDVIASAKKLKQGITLEGVVNCILVSYYKESWHMIQQLGRIVRFVPGKQGNLYVFRTFGTYEEKWYENMNVIKNDKDKKIGTINLNVVEELFSNTLL